MSAEDEKVMPQVGDLIDLCGPEHVDITIRNDGKVIWVNVNGKCAVRIYQIKSLTLDDRRRGIKAGPTAWDEQTR